MSGGATLSFVDLLELEPRLRLHTVGLRHNFTSSFDAYNYRPQYWQLRTNNGAVTDACSGPVSDGNACIGPRYYDPLTPEEINQSIETWAQTSVMDYAGESTQDWVGLGIYDYAAVRAFYADAVDVRNDDLRALPAHVAAGDPVEFPIDLFHHLVHADGLRHRGEYTYAGFRLPGAGFLAIYRATTATS